MLYQVVRDHYHTFRTEASQLREGEGLPHFVDDAVDAFPRCGWLAGGFARFRCTNCRAERLVAFCFGREQVSQTAGDGRGHFEAGSANCPSSIENRGTEHVPRGEPRSNRLSRLPVTAAIMPADRPKGEPHMKNAHSAPATPGLLRRRLTLALLAFSMFVGTFAATAAPAHAASSMAACFYTPNKTRLTGLPVRVEYWNGYSWVFTGSTLPMQQSNCVYASISGSWQNYHLRFNVNLSEGYVFWYLNPGMPIPYAPAGNQHSPLGYLSVICTGSITRCGVDY